MLLVDNYDKFDAGTMCIGNAVKQILSLAVTNGCIAFLRDKLPVDEGCTFRIKSVMQRIEQILCLTVGSKLSHLLSALFFQIALARTKPNKRSLAVDFG